MDAATPAPAATARGCAGGGLGLWGAAALAWDKLLLVAALLFPASCFLSSPSLPPTPTPRERTTSPPATPHSPGTPTATIPCHSGHGSNPDEGDQRSPVASALPPPATTPP